MNMRPALKSLIVCLAWLVMAGPGLADDPYRDARMAMVKEIEQHVFDHVCPAGICTFEDAGITAAAGGGPAPAPEVEPAGKPRPVRREAPKVGRNDPCPCGSGKKYKRCCGG